MSTTPTARRRVITRQVVEWAAWDWGSAAFNAVATTFVFTTYLTSDGVFTDAGTASTWLSNGMTIAGLFIALLAPITGQRADRRGRGRVWWVVAREGSRQVVVPARLCAAGPLRWRC